MKTEGVPAGCACSFILCPFVFDAEWILGPCCGEASQLHAAASATFISCYANARGALSLARKTEEGQWNKPTPSSYNVYPAPEKQQNAYLSAQVHVLAVD